MRKTGHRGQRNRTGGFTLYELVITIGLFALVAGLVISYIGFMTDFSRSNRALSDRTSQLTAIRREVDYWFSAYDGGYAVTVPPEEESEGELVLAYAVGNGRYEMRLALIPDASGAFTRTLVCEYPPDAMRGTLNADGTLRQARIECPNVLSVRLTERTDGWTFDDTAEGGLRFGVDMRVSGRQIACEVTYA